MIKINQNHALEEKQQQKMQLSVIYQTVENQGSHRRKSIIEFYRQSVSTGILREAGIQTGDVRSQLLAPMFYVYPQKDRISPEGLSSETSDFNITIPQRTRFIVPGVQNLSLVIYIAKMEQPILPRFDFVSQQIPGD